MLRKTVAMKFAASVAVAALLLSGCARNHVAPVSMLEVKQVCIIENPRVRADFLEAYRKALQDKGYQADVIPEGSSLGACPVTSKYVAYWAWDLVLYMTSAQLDVYRDGRPAGRALFRARGSRLFTTDSKVRELVDHLYK